MHKLYLQHDKKILHFNNEIIGCASKQYNIIICSNFLNDCNKLQFLLGDEYNY